MRAKRREFLRNEIPRQQRWIEACENNGKSYTGLNGDAVRQADNNHLIALEREYRGNKGEV